MPRSNLAPTANPSPPMAPTSILWSTLADTVFINTGREVFARYDYLLSL